MKHKYNKLIIFLYYVFCFIGLFTFLFVLALAMGDLNLFKKNALTMTILFCIGYGFYDKKRMNRYVEFFDEYVHFHSLNIVRRKKEYYLNVRYEDIYEISVKKSSFISIYLIYVKARNFGYAIPLNCFYAKHKKMYATLYQKVIKANPDAKIDQDFIDFLERKKLL